MKNLTDKQIKLLLSNKEDLKAIVLKWAGYTDSGVRTLEADFDSFASQFERKPRFVTNGDGEQIFDGEEYRFIWSNELLTRVADFGIDGARNEGNEPHITYFKSKEKAEAYITLNAPRLSVNDVMEVVGQYVFAPSFYKDKLVELVKSKL